MLCNRCNKNEATIYYKQNINGEVREYALCPECAAKQGMGLSGVNLFGSLFSQSIPKREHKRCTLCASSFEDIRRSGKVGCAECYSVFSEELRPMISNIHSGEKHCGRAPGEEGEKRRAHSELEKLRAELQTAIANEEYERAATLRDMIKEMEAENNG